MFDTNVTAAGNSAPLTDIRGSGARIVQVSFDSGIAGSVTILGRVSEDCNWVVIQSGIAADTFVPVLPVPLLRFDVTVNSGGGGAACIRVRVWN